MRLHRLAMCAIGPFAGEVQIDFARLGESGLFLLEGPTGSGKSTIIDAVSFALYGKVAQASATAERLRSHHAGTATESWVDLVFETQSGLFRVRRTPSFDRPKRDGSGVRKVNTTVKLWRLTSPDAMADSEPLSTRIAEADDELTRAVGLTHDQFVQTMVLPQGEFASFLRSRTEDKKTLLQKLFGTEIVAATQERLINGKREAEQRRSAAESAVQKAVQSFAGAAGLDEEVAAELDAAAGSANADGLTEIVTGLVAGRGQLAQRTGALLDAAAAEQRAAAQALQVARDLLRRQHRRAELLSRQRTLIEQTTTIDEQRQRVQAAERAARALGSAQALSAAIEQSDRAQDLLATTRAALAPQHQHSDEATLRAAAASTSTLLGSLADAAQREARLVSLRHDQRTVARELAACAAALSKCESERAAIPNRIEECERAHGVALTAAAREPIVLAEHQRAEARLAAAERAEQAALTLAQEAQITREAASAWDAQEQRLMTLRLSWRAGVAGELGVALVAGDPCAVCGSIEHPAPARPRSDHVSQDDLDAAEGESRRLREAAEQARHELERQQTELIALQLEADQLTPMQARTTLEQVAATLTEARDAVAERDRVAAELGRLRAELDRIGTEIARRESERAALDIRAATVHARIAEDESIVEVARAGRPSVLDRIQDLNAELAALQQAAEAVRQAAHAVERAVECGAGFRSALDAAGFTDEAHWQACLLADSQLSALRESMSSFEAESSTVNEQLAEPELADPALDDPTPDVEPLEAAQAAAEAHAAELAAVAGAARERFEDAQRRGSAVERAVAANSEILRSTAAAVRLGNLAAGIGENQLRMDLTTFVLIRRFADVVSAANSQLRRVSSGRYELEHSDAKTGNAKSGLGLRVLDLHTGKPRDPATLSGGETFYVSLALALGLADVVRSESGGIDLGTLFVDEGFGSLDPEVLDEVLAVLDSLRAGGRAVGVVSHVAELKSRIPERIAVSRVADGSSRLTLIA